MKTLLTGAFLSALMVAGWTSAATAENEDTLQLTAGVYHKAVCGRPVGLMMQCQSRIVTDRYGTPLSSKQPPINGYAPADLQSAYNITTTGSSSTIIAIVDAFGYDSAEADLGVYRAQWGLPACTTGNGCFKKLNQRGKQGHYPAQNLGWAQESALDVDMASAMCPNCQIWLVEADNNKLRSLAASVDLAASLGAHVISNSYGGGDRFGTSLYEDSYTHPGVAVTASSGDGGYGTIFPSSSPHVTAVGGTHLVHDGSARGWAETAWAGAGSGCSKTHSKPAWQTDQYCSTRTVADVSAVADPATGVAVYGPTNSGSAWLKFGGTSVSAPIIGGIYGNNGGTVSYGSNPYAHTDALYDVVGGSNGSCGNGKSGVRKYLCTAVAGYDGPTGLGTPNGTAAFGEH